MRITRNISIQITKPKKVDQAFLADQVPDSPEKATDDVVYIRDSKADIIKAVALLTLVNGVVVIGAVYTLDYLRKRNGVPPVQGQIDILNKALTESSNVSLGEDLAKKVVQNLDKRGFAIN